MSRLLSISLRTLVTFLFVGASASAGAADGTDPPASEKLPGVTITSTRSDLGAIEQPVSASVVSREQILATMIGPTYMAA